MHSYYNVINRSALKPNIINGKKITNIVKLLHVSAIQMYVYILPYEVNLSDKIIFMPIF